MSSLNCSPGAERDPEEVAEVEDEAPRAVGAQEEVWQHEPERGWPHQHHSSI